MDSPRDREDLLREITEICGAAGTVGDGEGEGVGDATTTEAVPSKTKSVQFICESVV